MQQMCQEGKRLKETMFSTFEFYSRCQELEVSAPGEGGQKLNNVRYNDKADEITKHAVMRAGSYVPCRQMCGA